LREPDFAGRVDVSVREEAAQLVSPDRIAHVEVGAKVILACRDDCGEGDCFAPFRVGRRRVSIRILRAMSAALNVPTSFFHFARPVMSDSDRGRSGKGLRIPQ